MCCGYFTVFTPALLYLCTSAPFVLCIRLLYRCPLTQGPAPCEASFLWSIIFWLLCLGNGDWHCCCAISRLHAVLFETLRIQGIWIYLGTIQAKLVLVLEGGM